MNRYAFKLPCALLLLAAGCMQGTAPETESSRAVDDGEIARITGDQEFASIQAQLESHGDLVMIDEGVSYSLDGRYAAVFPVEAANGGQSEYSSLIYQENESGSAVYLELSGDESTSDALPEGPEGEEGVYKYSCGGWGEWYTVGSYCEWHIKCLGDATMWRRERKKLCCSGSGNCWYEYEHTTVRHACGC